MKKLFTISLLILGIMSINAQEKDKFRVGLDFGYVFAKDGGGALFSIEPKYNITDNSNIGLRIGSAASVSEGLNETDANVNILATYDYYFNSENSSTAPFLGAGLGWFLLGDTSNDTMNDINLGEQFGALVRGGVELGKLRIALEYNILPKSDLEFGESIKNSYLGASIGFYVGGGKWEN